MGTRKKRQRQHELWMAAGDIVQTPANAFYDQLNGILERRRFDKTVEHLCRRYYKGPYGRPSLAPGVYFRMLLIGYFEGLDSERGIAWRVADSLSLRRFLGYALDESNAGSLNGIAHPATDLGRDTQSGVWVGVEGAG